MINFQYYDKNAEGSVQQIAHMTARFAQSQKSKVKRKKRIQAFKFIYGERKPVCTRRAAREALQTEVSVRKTSREIRRELTQAPKFIYGVTFDF